MIMRLMVGPLNLVECSVVLHERLERPGLMDKGSRNERDENQDVRYEL